MSEWTVNIETVPGLTTEVDDLDRFDDRMREREIALGVSTSMNAVRGSLSATFAVEAEDPQSAVDLAVPAFIQALLEAGLPEEGTLAKVGAEPSEDRELVYA